MDNETIDQKLKDALTHLNDPDQSPPTAMWELVDCDPEDGILAFQSALIESVEGLQPSENTSKRARIRQLYEVLRDRFILQMTLEETAERMHMSVSSAWRMQQEAVHTLARVLWEQKQREEDQEEQGVVRKPSVAQATDWRSQAQRELASLHASAPNAKSDVGAIIKSVLSLGAVINLDPQVVSIQPNLIATVHPSILRQILITTISRITDYAQSGTLRIFARFEGGRVRITVTATLSATDDFNEDALTEDIVMPENVTVSLHVNVDHLFLWIDLPSTGAISVAVVDDNPDMVRFYRRCTEGTQYHISPITEAQTLFERIRVIKPAVIVLDIMLPDIDGWEMLTRLHEDPITRGIPVIVCSVIREAQLALSLGAAYYLPKPVRPPEFKQALDRALAQVS
jgi:CheY-like chemotaxis protein